MKGFEKLYGMVGKDFKAQANLLIQLVAAGFTVRCKGGDVVSVSHPEEDGKRSCFDLKHTDADGPITVLNINYYGLE